jgi:hypothetical protein
MMLIQLQLSTLNQSVKDKMDSSINQQTACSSMDISERNNNHSKSRKFPKESPIKSLSTLASNPLVPLWSHSVDKISSEEHKKLIEDPITANLTSCLCKRLNSQRPENKPCCSDNNEAQKLPSAISFREADQTSFHTNIETCEQPLIMEGVSEASRNLTQTLRKLSEKVFSKEKYTETASQNSQQTTSSDESAGAVIESMKHHGKGVYTGTFSGTLNPALQDKNGISTIIHILNDLLSASPQCSRNEAKIFFEPTQTTGPSPIVSIRLKSKRGIIYVDIHFR